MEMVPPKMEGVQVKMEEVPPKMEEVQVKMEEVPPEMEGRGPNLEGGLENRGAEAEAGVKEEEGSEGGGGGVTGRMTAAQR
eukprot:2745917-Rhodomonas_salina.1